MGRHHGQEISGGDPASRALGQHELSHQVRAVQQGHPPARGPRRQHPKVPQARHGAPGVHPPQHGERTPTACLERGYMFLDIFAGSEG
eukprot:8885345-Pyramimonas_sp.AAC.1